MNRRRFLTASATAAAGIAAGGAFDGASPPAGARSQDGRIIAIDPTPLFELSPYLFMQFMEPLGATDGSVEAAWDHLRPDWRDDVVAITRELGPTMMRWGGIFADFYRWREGVGPRESRPPMLNLLWAASSRTRSGRSSSWTCAGEWARSRSSA